MTKHFLFSAALALAVLAPVPGHAGFVSGNDLAALCRANMGGQGHVTEAAECLGYVVGVADTFDCVESLHGFHWQSKAGVSQPQLVNTVLHWLDTHPAVKAYESDGLIAAALAEAYPCTAQQ